MAEKLSTKTVSKVLTSRKNLIEWWRY